MEIKEICSEIMFLLESVDERLWSNSFKNVIQQFDSLDKIFAAKELIRIYGGAASFNDLVLYKNNHLCSEENEKLDYLRRMLFQKLKEVDTIKVKQIGVDKNR